VPDSRPLSIVADTDFAFCILPHRPQQQSVVNRAGDRGGGKSSARGAKKKHKTVGNGGKKVTDTATTTESPTVSKTESEAPQTPSLFDQQSHLAAADSTDATAQAIAHAD